jgi:hypothetical protein
MSTASLHEVVVGEEPAAATLPSPSPWPFAKRFALCAGFVFFVFVNWPFPLDLVPYLAEWIYPPVAKVTGVIVQWAAKTLFHVSADVLPNGSGDTTYNYVQAALWIAAALVLGALLAPLIRKRTRSDRTYEIFRIYLRFALAVTLVGYGMAKIIQLQFPTPGLERLVQPYGTSSPMGILWSFMGVSRAYNLLTGGAEVLAAILLTTRRTTLAGGLLAMGVMGNIAALNYSYDVPVKLYSTELFLMAAVVVAPDARRLVDLFFRARQQPLFRRASLETASLVLRTLLVTAFVLYAFYEANASRKVYGDLAPRSPLRGIWNVDQLTENGTPRPPLVTDAARWRRVVFDRPTYSSILLMSDARTRYMVDVDEKKHTASFKGRDDPKVTFTLAYTQPDPNTLTLDGVVDHRSLHATCHRAAATDLLLTRGFHWVNEYPYNR